MAKKKGERTEIFSVFGQLEAVAAEIMIKDGVGTKIPPEQIPASVAVNQFGDRARFAVILPKSKIAAFNNLVADLRA